MTSFQEIINSDTPTLVDFHAMWCGPCKAMSPVIDKVKTILGANIRILKVDVDKNQGVAAKYKIRTVPTLILFKNGEILWRKSGEMSPKELENYIRLAS